MRLQPGDYAPPIDLPSFEGTPFNLQANRGRWLLLSFYRYASCPFCNLRIHNLSKESARLKGLGLDLVAVFQSPEAKVREHAGGRNLTYPILCDPTEDLYRQYGVETSWAGFFGGMMLKMPKMFNAFFKGYLPGSMEGHINRMPADFLIAPDGTIRLAYYGSDLADHLSLNEVIQVLPQG
ncbi:MAG: peroxiredoxin-like family protein [bacterium]|nr:peroxiredoxin-like family protein [bacterium]